MSQRTFGRRIDPMPALERKRLARRPVIEVQVGAEPVLASSKTGQAVEEEIREWSRSRRHFTFPWRQLALMASLCFGIGAFALPDSINSVVQWLLFGLTAASFTAGLLRRRAERN